MQVHADVSWELALILFQLTLPEIGNICKNEMVNVKDGHACKKRNVYT